MENNAELLASNEIRPCGGNLQTCSDVLPSSNGLLTSREVLQSAAKQWGSNDGQSGTPSSDPRGGSAAERLQSAEDETEGNRAHSYDLRAKSVKPLSGNPQEERWSPKVTCAERVRPCSKSHYVQWRSRTSGLSNRPDRLRSRDLPITETAQKPQTLGWKARWADKFKTPSTDWSSPGDLHRRFQTFKQKCQLIIDGPLADKIEAYKVQMLLLWSDDKGLEIYNTATSANDGDDLLLLPVWEKARGIRATTK